jgi:hypothetical protein
VIFAQGLSNGFLKCYMRDCPSRRLAFVGIGNLLATGERKEMMKARINADCASTSDRNGLRRGASVHRQRYHVGRPCASLVRIRGRQGKPGSFLLQRFQVPVQMPRVLGGPEGTCTPRHT